MYTPSQGLTTHDGYLAPGSEPGVPDIVTTFFTPSRPASSMVRRRSSACLGPTAGSGLSGLPLQFRPVSSIPRDAKTSRYSRRACSEDSNRSTWQCGEGMKPPVLTSTELSPFDFSTSRASASGRSCKQAVYAPSFSAIRVNPLVRRVVLRLLVGGLPGGDHLRT